MLGWVELCQHTLLDDSEVRLLLGFRVVDFRWADSLGNIAHSYPLVVSKVAHLLADPLIITLVTMVFLRRIRRVMTHDSSGLDFQFVPVTADQLAKQSPRARAAQIPG